MSLLSPHRYLPSALDVDFDEMIASGRSAMLLDLDNTILARDKDQVAQEYVEWIARAKARGISVCILSNNWHERVSVVARQLDVELVAKAIKPLPFAFFVAMRRLGVRRDQTFIVGDQIFTDVLGGRLVGIMTVMVLPLAKHDLRHTLMLRHVERLILAGRTPEQGASQGR